MKKISEIVNEFNATHVSHIRAPQVTEQLVNLGYLYINDNHAKYVTELGKEKGITEETRINNAGKSFNQILYSEEAELIVASILRKLCGIVLESPKPIVISEKDYNINVLGYENDESAKEYSPNIPMTIMEKSRMISGYRDSEALDEEDTDFLKTDKCDCFGRMDFDTSLMPIDKTFQKHFYNKVYISTAPKGPMVLLNKQTVWQVEAGLYKRFPPENIHTGANFAHYFDSGLVISWKSPIASTYYNNDETQKVVKSKYNYIHDLMLRRRLENNQYQTLFIAGEVVGEESAYDPFLIQVLKERGDSHELRDIIRTIQANQNEIIRKDLNENMIVQGCAGSGKTMILLHRISVLMYNNPQIPAYNYEIITPNKLFDAHVDGLSKALELNDVKRKTPEELYIDILDSLKPQYTKSEDVLPDSKGNNDIVKYVYSDAFLDLIRDESGLILKELREKKIALLQLPILIDINDKYSFDIDIPDRKDNEGQEGLLLRLKHFFDDIDKQLQRVKTINKNIQELYNQQENDAQRIRNIFEKRGTLGDIGFNDEEITELNGIIAKRQKQIKELAQIGDFSEAVLIASEKFIKFDKKSRNAEVKAYLESIDFPQKRLEKQFTGRKIGFSTYSDRINAIIQKAVSEGFSPELFSADVAAELYKDCDYMSSIKQAYAAAEADIDLDDYFTRFFSRVINEKFAEPCSNDWYRYTLYAKAQFYYLITGQLSIGSSFIRTIHSRVGKYLFVDEAQDFAINELKFLHTILGDTEVFNLFGDVNQLIRDGYGIGTWDSIREYADYNYYEINENYRNTINITDYCNKVLNRNDLAIGYLGDNVLEIDNDFAKELMKSDLGERTRTAVIVNSICPELIDEISEVTREKPTVNKIEEDRIAILDVEHAKGLEFDIVFAYKEGMSYNQQYVAFTRALTKLFVVEK